jgi:hypothetical protein
MPFLEDIAYSFPKEAILKRLNRKGGVFTDIFSKMWKDMEILLYEIIKPIGGYERLELLGRSGSYEVKVEKLGVIRSKILYRLLNGASFVYVLACTLGEEVENKVRELSEEERLSEAVLLDAMASEVIDSVCDTINNTIKSLAKANRKSITRRVSPGYGDIPLFLNKKIIDIVGKEKLGVKVLDSGLMYPQKSITAIIGVI